MNLIYLQILFLLLVATTTPAYAYSDPGSGLMLFQLLGAAIVGCLFYVKKFWDLFLNVLRKRKHNNE